MGKGLVRNEIIASKEILETVVRPRFMKVLEWKVGIENDFDVSIGKPGSFCWKALFIMTEIFQQVSNFVAETFCFEIKKSKQGKALAYLQELHAQ